MAYSVLTIWLVFTVMLQGKSQGTSLPILTQFTLYIYFDCGCVPSQYLAQSQRLSFSSLRGCRFAPLCVSINAEVPQAENVAHRAFTFFFCAQILCVRGGIKYSTASFEIMVYQLSKQAFGGQSRGSHWQEFERAWGVFSVVVKAGWVLGNLFVVLFFLQGGVGHTSLASAMWKGNSQELWRYC